MGQKCEGNCGLWVLNEIIKKIYPENLKKKSWVPFGSYLLNSTADPAQFDRMYFFNYFIKNPQTTIALTFMTYIISAISGVHSYPPLCPYVIVKWSLVFSFMTMYRPKQKKP